MGKESVLGFGAGDN